VGFGINDKTVDRANAVMGRTVLVPGAGPNPTHYHANNDVCWHIMSGKIRLIQARSDGSDRKEVTLEAGDFVYVPREPSTSFQCVSDRGGHAGFLLHRRWQRRSVPAMSG